MCPRLTVQAWKADIHCVEMDMMRKTTLAYALYVITYKFSDIESLIGDRNSGLLRLYESLMLRRLLSTNPDTRWCPGPNCTYAVIATGCASCPKITCERPGKGRSCHSTSSAWNWPTVLFSCRLWLFLLLPLQGWVAPQPNVRHGQGSAAAAATTSSPFQVGPYCTVLTKWTQKVCFSPPDLPLLPSVRSLALPWRLGWSPPLQKSRWTMSLCS